MPASRRSKVEAGEEFDDMECIGLVPTLDIATGRPFEKRDEEMGLGTGAGGYDGGNVWGGGTRSASQTGGGDDMVGNEGVGESAVWEKV